MRIALALITTFCLFVTSVQAAEVVEKITFVNKLIDGKKVWTPGEQQIKAGTKVEIVLVNELEEPHGFSLPGLAENIVVKAKETKTVNITAPKDGEIKFHCQMHPAHVGGVIKVK